MMRFFYITGMIILMLWVYNAQALTFSTSTEFKITNDVSYDTAVMYGYNNSKIGFGNLYFTSIIMRDNNEYLYNLSDNKVKFIYSVYPSLEWATHVLFFGYAPSIGSFESIQSFNNQKNIYMGVKGLSHFKNGESNHLTLINTYLNNNMGLTTGYLIKLFDDTLRVGTSFTPNINYSLRDKKTVSQNNKSLFDGAIMYYNEYNYLGYGVNIGLRKHINTQEIELNNPTLSLGFNLDLMGFNLHAGYINGNNSISLQDNNDFTNLEGKASYNATEFSIYYSFLDFTIGSYTLLSTVNANHTTYDTSLTEFDINYQLGQYMILSTGVFTEQVGLTSIKSNNNYGVLLGVGFTI